VAKQDPHDLSSLSETRAVRWLSAVGTHANEKVTAFDQCHQPSLL
jgi:hypothetical protein